VAHTPKGQANLSGRAPDTGGTVPGIPGVTGPELAPKLSHGVMAAGPAGPAPGAGSDSAGASLVTPAKHPDLPGSLKSGKPGKKDPAPSAGYRRNPANT
jgi:hypothetical protein